MIFPHQRHAFQYRWQDYRALVLDTEYEGQIRDAFGKQRAAFSAETTFSRKEFGVNWNGLIETGGVVVSDQVRVMLNIAAVRED